MTADKILDQYQWWRDALAGKNPPIHADEPQSGFFKLRRKNKSWLPVAIWREGSILHCRLGASTAQVTDVWTYCASHPVSKTDANYAFQHGSWPGDVVIEHKSKDRSIGDIVGDAIRGFYAWHASNDPADLTSKDAAGNWKAEILAVGKRAKAERDEKIAPHKQIIDAIKAEYEPMIGQAEDAYRLAQDRATAIYKAVQRKADEVAAEAARKENEKRLAEYERQKKEAAEQRKNEPVAPPTFVAPAPVKIQGGGQAGKKTSLRRNTLWRIDDYALALAHAKDHPDVIAAVEKVCFAQARAGATVPGVSSYIEEIAV